MLAESEIRLSRDSKRLLKAQGTRAKNAYKESTSIPAVTEAIKNGQGNWRKVLMAHYAITISHFVDYTKIVLTGSKSVKTNFATRIQEFIANQGLNKSKLITETTIEKARSIINDGQSNGDSEQDIGNALEEGIGGAVSDSRSRTIARTETHNAATYAMQETAEQAEDQTGLTITREWVAVHDDRTREAHANADGQEVGIDEPFEVDGEELDRPGDENGSPENVINCRCTIIYHTTDHSGNESDTDTSEEDAIGPGGFIGD
jgi:uncharacterized protein with gpF-like domain